jgi:hypothetical protein
MVSLLWNGFGKDGFEKGPTGGAEEQATFLQLFQVHG